MGLEYKDMEGIVKPKIHIDQFKSKMGEDDDVSVISFYVENEKAAEDLMSWFERGYDFILDADRSPGEIKPNKYLVYVEMRRRSNLANNLSFSHWESQLVRFDISLARSTNSKAEITSNKFLFIFESDNIKVFIC